MGFNRKFISRDSQDVAVPAGSGGRQERSSYSQYVLTWGVKQEKILQKNQKKSWVGASNLASQRGSASKKSIQTTQNTIRF